MKQKLFTLIVLLLLSEILYAQMLPSSTFYQRPERTLTDYQKLYAENLVENTQNYRLKGKVKSVSISLISSSHKDTVLEHEEHGKGIENTVEIHKYDFLPNNILQTSELLLVHKYPNQARIDSSIQITNYYFNEDKSRLIQILKTTFNRHNDKRFTETNFDNKGFQISQYYYGKGPREREMYHTETFHWNKKRTVVHRNYNYVSPSLGKGHKRHSYRGESYKRPFYNNRILVEHKHLITTTTHFDANGNIISLTSNDLNIRSSLPDSYNFTYTYNDNNELLSIQNNGSTRHQMYDKTVTTFKYDNYDDQDNWQEMTISSSNSEKKYKRTITYY